MPSAGVSEPSRRLIAVPLILSIAACGGGAADSGGGTAGDAEAWFVDATARRGVDFRYESGAAGKAYLPECMGAGLGLFDADGDGDLDLYLLNGNAAPVDPGPSGGHQNRFYEMDAAGRYVDRTEASGLGDGGYGMGMAVADIDNDGDRDVYVTNLGLDRLYLNEGAGKFRDITDSAGVNVPGWSCSAAFFDYDRDGYLDLFITRYVDFDPRIQCQDKSGRPDYCSPKVYAPLADVLLHNDGDGTFTDRSVEAGLTSSKAAGLGLACEDLNDDGRIDIYVANDGYANQLWVNQGDGTFVDMAHMLGAALNMDGRAEAGMGVVVADFNGDLNPDLFVTHLASESNTLYLNRGDGRGFDDSTGKTGLAGSSILYTGFGAAAFDAELDGDLDILIVGGRVARKDPSPDSLAPAPWDRYAEANLFYTNDGEGRFRRQTELIGALGSSLEVTRGLAAGDLDGDGDLDMVIGNIESPARTYECEAPRAGNWLLVRAFDPRLSRDALGARIIVTAGGRRFLRTISAGSSYLSSSDQRAHFGLGEVAAIDAVEILWPDGLHESFQVDCVDCSVELRRGEGRGI